MMEPMHTYDELDKYDEARSSTEVDESLMGDEKPWHKQQPHQPLARRSIRSKIISALWSLRWVVDTLLLLAILGLLVRDQLRKPEVNQWDFGGDFTGVGPRCRIAHYLSTYSFICGLGQEILAPRLLTERLYYVVSQKIVKFEMDPSYAPTNSSEFFTDEVLEKWNELMPVGMGFVWVNDTHKYHDLPTPIDWPDKTVFTTSVTHQLHCLVSISLFISLPFSYFVITSLYVLRLTTDERRNVIPFTVCHRPDLLRPQGQSSDPG